MTGGGLPAEIWRDFMLPAHADRPLAGLPGGYPSVDWERERRLRTYYSELSAAFRDASDEEPDQPEERRGFRLFRRN